MSSSLMFRALPRHLKSLKIPWKNISTFNMTDSVSSIVKVMKAAGIHRGFIITNSKGQQIASHPVLQPIASFLTSDSKSDFDQHEALFFGISPRTGDLLSAFLWKTHRGQACGGIRLRPYRTVEEYIRDGLRLASGMGRKSSLAGLYWGGGKGIIPSDAGVQNPQRRELLEDYGEFVSSLHGCYVAAQDVGININDVDVVFSKTRFVVGISPHLGGSGSPSTATALGVKVAMESALNAVASTSLEGKTVAIQGLGGVGSALVGYLLESGVSKIIGSDVSEHRITDLLRRHEEERHRLCLRLELPHTPYDSSIVSEECDVFSPCAFGGVLNEDSVPHIKASIVCGSANNQLLDPNSDCGMQKRGVTFVPDVVCSRMGIVNVSCEMFGSYSGGMVPYNTDDPLFTRHLSREWEHSIYQVAAKIIRMARDQQMTTSQAAQLLADEYVEEEHPICGHRSRDIVQSLVENGWAC